MKFDLNDVLLTPSKITNIESRYNDIDPFYSSYMDRMFRIVETTKHYPIMTAPMSSVVDRENAKEFKCNNIPVVLPRTIGKNNYNIEYRKALDLVNFGNLPKSTFFSYSLNDFERYYVSDSYQNHKGNYPTHILIDIANGHIRKIFDLIEKARNRYDDLIIMAGNIANPETYKMYADSGLIDFVRIGIGNGNGCLTTQQLGVGYPIGSLIQECKEIKDSYVDNINAPMIIADGGMKGYSDIIKALALGADYVMVGSIFSKALESAGDSYLYGLKINQKLANKIYPKFPIKKKFYGMSTKIAQLKMGNSDLKTSEGVIRYYNVEYKLKDWVDNFQHYLRSAMSYSNAKKLSDFIGKVDYNLITENAYDRFKK